MPVNTEIFVRIYAAVLTSAVFGFAFRHTWRAEHRMGPSAFEQVWGIGQKDKRTEIVTATLVFPWMLALIFAMFVLQSGWKEAAARFFHLSADLLLTMSVFYALLLLLMPVLRRRISARACATAWLLPTYLYVIFCITHVSLMPRIVFYCPSWLARLLVPVWAVGFALVFAWFVISHLRFCRRILAASSDETDEQVLAVWRQNTESFGLHTPVRLVRCKAATTPFSIGIGKKSRVTVLPAYPYTASELHLIFRHELHHIRRNDVASKLFFAFLCALFWFHPLVWIAARESAKDLELSCDEIVLEEADDDERRLYARLLLHTAGERHGFTTCLSADAKSLRYRLTHVMHARTCRLGTGLLIALLSLCITCHGVLAFSDERTSLGTLLADNGTAGHFLYEVYDYTGYRYRSLSDADLKEGAGEELLACLSPLFAEHLSDSETRSPVTGEHSPRLYISDESGTQFGMWIYDDVVQLYRFYETDLRKRTSVYYLRGSIDWEKIESCFLTTCP